MNYEVMHGEQTHFVQAGNQYAACLNVLREEAKQDDIRCGPFRVKPLPLGESETIDMALVLKLQYMSVNGEQPTQKKMDLSCW